MGYMTLLRTAMEGVVNSLQQASGILAPLEQQIAVVSLPNLMPGGHYLRSLSTSQVSTQPTSSTSNNVDTLAVVCPNINFQPVSLASANLSTNALFDQPASALSMRPVPQPISAPQPISVPQPIAAIVPISTSTSNTIQPTTGGDETSCKSVFLSAAERTRIGMMALKIPLDSFSPLKHVPLDWLDSFDAHCNNVSKAYNLNLEKLIIDNLYSLCPKEDKHWLIQQINNGRTFSWVELRQNLLDHFSKRCNEKFKELYMKEWDEPLTLVEFAEEKLKQLKEIWPEGPLKKLIDVVRSGLPDDISIGLSKIHLASDNEGFFLDCLAIHDREREQARLQLLNENRDEQPLNSTLNDQATANANLPVNIGQQNDVFEQQILRMELELQQLRQTRLQNVASTAPTITTAATVSYVSNVASISPIVTATATASCISNVASTSSIVTTAASTTITTATITRMSSVPIVTTATIIPGAFSLTTTSNVIANNLPSVVSTTSV